MKRLLLVTLFVLSHGPACANWVAVEKNNQPTGSMNVYVDPDTIRRKENLATIWQLNDYKTMQGGRSPSRFSSRKLQKQFDCVGKRLRLLALTDFWGNMGTGESSGAHIDGGNWIPVAPDSIDQTLWELVCDKK